MPELRMVVLHKRYWIINFPTYGTFVFYGTDIEAQELFTYKEKWENCPGVLRLADPSNKQDWELVNKEIDAVKEDKAAGIKGLPTLPKQDGF